MIIFYIVLAVIIILAIATPLILGLFYATNRHNFHPHSGRTITTRPGEPCKTQVIEIPDIHLEEHPHIPTFPEYEVRK
jgi:hypothetical protein